LTHSLSLSPSYTHTKALTRSLTHTLSLSLIHTHRHTHTHTHTHTHNSSQLHHCSIPSTNTSISPSLPAVRPQRDLSSPSKAGVNLPSLLVQGGAITWACP